MRTFSLTIRDTTSLVYRGMVAYCGIRTAEGGYGLEAGHEPFMSMLEPGGEIRWRSEDGSEGARTLSSGMLIFRGGECSVIAEAQPREP
jgi:F0F1-type ATP synthase epsilon subunit